MASAQALGVDVASLFGGRKLPAGEREAPAPAIGSTENAAALPESTEDYQEIPFEEAEAAFDSSGTSSDSTAELAAQASAGGENEFDALTQSLEQWVVTYKDLLNVTLKNGANPYKLAQEELDANNFNASVESRKAMIQRVKDFLKTRNVNL